MVLQPNNLPASVRPSFCVSLYLFMVNLHISFFFKKKKCKKKRKNTNYENRHLLLGLKKHWYLSNLLLFFLSESKCAKTLLCLQYNTIQLYCQVTNAHGMCHGTKHTNTRNHTNHIKKKKKLNYNSENVKVI